VTGYVRSRAALGLKSLDQSQWSSTRTLRIFLFLARWDFRRVPPEFDRLPATNPGDDKYATLRSSFILISMFEKGAWPRRVVLNEVGARKFGSKDFVAS
jgi:hypothetical protein